MPYERIIHCFRRLSTPELTGVVASRFVFGLRLRATDLVPDPDFSLDTEALTRK